MNTEMRQSGVWNAGMHQCAAHHPQICYGANELAARKMEECDVPGTRIFLTPLAPLSPSADQRRGRTASAREARDSATTARDRGQRPHRTREEEARKRKGESKNWSSDAHHRVLPRASTHGACRTPHGRPVRRGADTTKAPDGRRLNPVTFPDWGSGMRALRVCESDGFGGVCSGAFFLGVLLGHGGGELRVMTWFGTSVSSSEVERERGGGR
ncbi:hypothetical protein DFH09DRAFT_1456688 [Mycena vulgaris]|nr:hypothetical protein DFH09DRAFT_1456688 [Mycena vulgaris]